jgi:hypothetical protein
VAQALLPADPALLAQASFAHLFGELKFAAAR